MQQFGGDAVVTADISGERLGAVLRKHEVMRFRPLGRGITGDVDSRDLHVAVSLHEQDRVRHRVQLGPVVPELRQDRIAVLAELQPGGTGFGTGFHRFGLGKNRRETVFGDEPGQYVRHELLLRLAGSAVHASVNLLAQLHPSVEHPPLVRQRGRIVVGLLRAVPAADDALRPPVMAGRQLHALQTLCAQVDLAARAAVHHDRRKRRLAPPVAGDQHRGQRHRMLGPDTRTAQIDDHRQLHAASVLPHLLILHPDHRKIAHRLSGFSGIRPDRAVCQHNQQYVKDMLHRVVPPNL